MCKSLRVLKTLFHVTSTVLNSPFVGPAAPAPSARTQPISSSERIPLPVSSSQSSVFYSAVFLLLSPEYSLFALSAVMYSLLVDNLEWLFPSLTLVRFLSLYNLSFMRSCLCDDDYEFYTILCLYHFLFLNKRTKLRKPRCTSSDRRRREWCQR